MYIDQVSIKSLYSREDGIMINWKDSVAENVIHYREKGNLISLEKSVLF